MHFYYVFWMFKSKPNCFYHAKRTTELPPEEFIPTIDMTDIEEFFIRNCTNKDEMDLSYSLYTSYRKDGHLLLWKRGK